MTDNERIKQAREAYYEAEQPAWEAYQKAIQIQPAWEAYQKAIQIRLAWEAYKKAIQPTWEAYQKVMEEEVKN